MVSLSLIEHGADLAATTNRGWTALHIAARFGCWAAVRLLLDQGADAHSKGQDGTTPEDVASLFSHTQIAEMIKAEAGRRSASKAPSFA